MLAPLTTGTLLTEEDPPVFEYSEGHISGLLITGDHAGTHVPAALNNLNCDINFGAVHIGCDPGIADLSREMARRGAETLWTNYSRAVIDPTRMPDSEHLIPEISDGIIIPGNLNIAAGDRQKRLDEIYRVYHKKYEELVAARRAQNPKTFILPIHSMEKRLSIDSTGKKSDGRDRPATAFIYREPDDALAEKIAEILRKRGVTDIGMNTPYNGKDKSYKFPSFEWHQTRLPHVVWEIRNDLLRTPEQVREWTDIILETAREIQTHHPDVLIAR